MQTGMMGTDGANPAGAPPATEKARPETRVDKQVKQAIAENRQNEIDRGALQDALNRNLNTPAGRQKLLLRSSYFPDHSAVYQSLHNQNDLLDENGQ
jgi:hypothetical protein